MKQYILMSVLLGAPVEKAEYKNVQLSSALRSILDAITLIHKSSKTWDVICYYDYAIDSKLDEAYDAILREDFENIEHIEKFRKNLEKFVAKKKELIDSYIENFGYPKAPMFFEKDKNNIMQRARNIEWYMGAKCGDKGK